MSGCTSATESEPLVQEVTEEEVVSEPTPEPEPEPQFAYSEVTDGQGYTFTLGLGEPVFSAVEGDVTNAPPGKTDLVMEYSLPVQIENTSAGRKLPGLTDIRTALILSADSPICAAEVEEVADYNVTQVVQTSVVNGYCFIEMNSYTTRGEVAPDSTLQLDVGFERGPLRINEADLDRVKTDFESAGVVALWPTITVEKNGYTFSAPGCAITSPGSTVDGDYVILEVGSSLCA